MNTNKVLSQLDKSIDSIKELIDGNFNKETVDYVLEIITNNLIHARGTISKEQRIGNL